MAARRPNAEGKPWLAVAAAAKLRKLQLNARQSTTPTARLRTASAVTKIRPNQQRARRATSTQKEQLQRPYVLSHDTHRAQTRTPSRSIHNAPEASAPVRSQRPRSKPTGGFSFDDISDDDYEGPGIFDFDDMHEQVAREQPPMMKRPQLKRRVSFTDEQTPLPLENVLGCASSQLDRSSINTRDGWTQPKLSRGPLSPADSTQEQVQRWPAI
jgi:hypothetical protein